MLTKRTVLILGAGASCHLGYPLGFGLISQICSTIKLKQYSSYISGRFSNEEISRFYLYLSRGNYVSVDACLEDNLVYVELGKFLIAECLKAWEEEDGLFLPNDSGWYRDLFLGLLAPSAAEFGANPLTVVTFNYDRSLEAYLHQSLMYRYKISSDAAAAILGQIQIIHPHGSLGQYPRVSYHNSAECFELEEISREIRIIHELGDAKDGFCSRDFEIAHRALQAAERIYFLGFGFHDENIRRFRFFTQGALEHKDVRGTVLLPPLQRVALLRRLRKEYGIGPSEGESSDGVEFGYDCRCNEFFRKIVSLE